MKQIIQDIIKIKKDRVVEAQQKQETLSEKELQIIDGARRKVFNKKFLKGKVLFAILVFVLALVSSAKIIGVFSRVVVQISPHQEIINIDTILRAGGAASELPLETMEIQLTEEKTAATTGLKNLQVKASGQIVIYNAFSSAPQTLVKNTRFESPEGKIYRIDKTIVVPGAKVESGEIVPSLIETTVYADSAGEEYNIDLTDFTIPGFRGDPRYEKFYARSKTPIVGGVKGEVNIITEEDYKNIQEQLMTGIEKKLLAKTWTQKPQDFLLYEDTINITFSEDPESLKVDDAADNFTLRTTGVLSAPLISKEELSRALVKKYLGEDFQDKIKVANLDGLDFQMLSRDEEGKNITFKIKNQAQFVWKVEEEELKNSLIASPQNLDGVFGSYPSIDRASVVFKPSWWRFFPKKTSKISVEQEI